MTSPYFLEARSRVSRHLAFEIYSLCLICLLVIVNCSPISASNGYCAPFTANTSNLGTNQAYDEYYSCCGISSQASSYIASAVYNYTNSTGQILSNSSFELQNIILNAANVNPPYIACRNSSKTMCCSPSGLNYTQYPIYLDETGRSIQYAFQLVPSNAVYTCVDPFAKGGCCSDSDCTGLSSLTTWIHGDIYLGFSNLAGSIDRNFLCSSSICTMNCPYNPLSIPRALILFLIPSVICIFELLMFLWVSSRNWMIDFTWGGFGLRHHPVVLKYIIFCLTPGGFHFLVIMNSLLAIVAHLVNAIIPADACVVYSDNGDTAEVIFAVGYSLAIIIPLFFRPNFHLIAYSRASPFSAGTSFVDYSMDVFVLTTFWHVVPFLWSMVGGSSPGQSWLDYLILLQQCFALRWFPLALGMFPFMCCIPPTIVSPSDFWGKTYRMLFRLVDQMFWNANCNLYDLDLESQYRGYNRRTSSAPGAFNVNRIGSSYQLLNITRNPVLIEAQQVISNRQQFVTHTFGGSYNDNANFDQAGCCSCWFFFFISLQNPGYSRAPIVSRGTDAPDLPPEVPLQQPMPAPMPPLPQQQMDQSYVLRTTHTFLSPTHRSYTSALETPRRGHLAVSRPVLNFDRSQSTLRASGSTPSEEIEMSERTTLRQRSTFSSERDLTLDDLRD